MPPLPRQRFVVGSRTSGLAMWQTDHVIERLKRAWPDLALEVRTFLTEGDGDRETALPEIGGKGVFTARLEQALAAGEIDLAVHSLKDLPVETGGEFTIGAVTSRTDPRDCIVARNAWTIATLPRGAVVGTSSLRRQAQLLARRPDLEVKPIRGNVETRVRKVLDGEYDAALLAAAGVTRLGLAAHVTEWIPADAMLPAPGQGALAVECRAEDEEAIRRLAAIDEPEVRAAVDAERAFLEHLGGGCSAPIAAYARVEGRRIHMTGIIGSPDGRRLVRVEDEAEDGKALARRLAARALDEGARPILAEFRARESRHEPRVNFSARGRAPGRGRSGSDSPRARLVDSALRNSPSTPVPTRPAAPDGHRGAAGGAEPARRGGSPRARSPRGWISDRTRGSGQSRGAVPSRALAGRRVVVTRARAQAEALCERLAALGAVPICAAAIRIERVGDLGPLDGAIARIESFDWVLFTSVNAVEIFSDRWALAGGTPADLRGTKVAAVGPATARSLAAWGVEPNFVPDDFLGDALAEGLAVAPGTRVLMPRAEMARRETAEILERRGAAVVDLPVYRTVAAEMEPRVIEDIRRGVDAVLFTSGSTVRHFMDTMRREAPGFAFPAQVRIACIGPVTAGAAREMGLRVDVVAEVSTTDGLVDALAESFSKSEVARGE